jgi:excisionase family DNA binding protein
MKNDSKSRYPLIISKERTEPEIPMEGNLTFLTVANSLLTPEEIKEAMDEGHAAHQEAMKKTYSIAGEGKDLPKETTMKGARVAFTIEQVAKILQCHVNTVRSEIRNGRLMAAKVGRDYRISRAQLITYWEGQGGGQLFIDDESEPAPGDIGRNEGVGLPDIQSDAADLTSREGKLALMVKLRKQGLEYQEIADELMKLGVKTSRGNTRWHKATVHAMIKKYL